MGQIEDLRLFVVVVENHGISKAADKLRIAKSAVSRRLSLLEERYGSRMIDRSAGVWSLTSTGHELFQRAVNIVGDADEIENDFSSTSAAVEGPLSVTVPREFGLAFLHKALIAFMQKFPEIQLTVDFDDRVVDLERENYDFAIRIAEDGDEGPAATRIGCVRHQLFASPNYLADAGMPDSLDELHNHPLLYFGSARRATWEFVAANAAHETFAFKPFLNSNSGSFLLNAVLNDLGIARLPDFITAETLEKGELVAVLPTLSIPDWGIFLVHSEDRRLNRRMRLFAEEMKIACVPEKASLA